MTDYPEADVEAEIIKAFLKWRSPFRVANYVGIGIATAYKVLEKHPHLTANTDKSAFPETNGGLGRPSLQPFAVARKRVTAAWDNTQEAIIEARLDYDAGTHEMFTGRDGDFLTLYSKPRRVPVNRESYFAL